MTHVLAIKSILLLALLDANQLFANVDQKEYSILNKYVHCHERYCSYSKFGLRWALNSYGEAVIWQFKKPYYIKISNHIIPPEYMNKSFLGEAGYVVRGWLNPLKIKRGYRFRYCDATTRTCNDIGSKTYYTAGSLAKLGIPFFEHRKFLPSEKKGELIDRRNKILLSALGLGGSILLTQMTLTGIVKKAFGAVEWVAKSIYDGSPDAKKLTDSIRHVSTKEIPTKSNVNRLLPRVAGIVGVAFFGLMHVKSWQLFSSSALRNHLYRVNAKAPIILSVPSMLASDENDHIEIEQLRDVFAAILQGDLGNFIDNHAQQAD